MELFVVVSAAVVFFAGAAFAPVRVKLAALRAERDTARAERDTTRAERDSALAEVARLTTALDYERRAMAERAVGTQQMRESFEALSAQALERSTAQLTQRAEAVLKAATTEARGDLDARRQAVEHLVAPLRDSLGKVETQLRQIEVERQGAYRGLTEQVGQMKESSERLRAETASLVTALRAPQVRGRWGEMQLRRVVEVAGMVEHCDFDEQSTSDSAEGRMRPDLVVHLAGGKHVVVDSKVPLDAFLQVAEATDEMARRAALAAHARQLRTHVDDLAKKSYGTRLPGTPEFVVMFVPGEALLSAALEQAPDLIEYGADRSVILATPTTLIALLRTVGHTWRQEALAANAQAVCDLGKELYTRLATMGGHVDKLGKSLNRSVASYNEAVSSLESRVLVSARRFADLKVSETELDPPVQVDQRARDVQAPELVESAAEASRLVVLPGASGASGASGEPATAHG